MAVLLVLAVASVSAYHVNSGVDRTSDKESDNDRSLTRDCDVNPYDSIDTCASNAGDTDDDMDDRSTVSDTWTTKESWTTNDRATVSDVSGTSTAASQWIMLRCRVGDESSTVSDRATVSDRGETSSTFGRTTARNASNGSSDNNVFDRNNTQTTSDSIQRRQVTSDRQTVSDAGMEMLECYVVEGNTDTYTTVSDTRAGDTRGFESPVVYSGTLQTQRTADNTDANDVIAEDDSGSMYTDNTGRTSRSSAD